MFNLTRSELAAALGVDPTRISQLVTDGRLQGCYRGEGRARRFNLEKTAAVLNVRLDTSQQTGNGVHQLARRNMIGAASGQQFGLPRPTHSAGPYGALADMDEKLEIEPGGDAKAIVAAKRLAIELDVRRKLREEQLQTGRYVLAEEAERATRAAVAETIAAAERFLVAEARRTAQTVGADPRAAAAETRQRWREDRARQAEAFALMADAATPTEAELREMGAACPANS